MKYLILNHGSARRLIVAMFHKTSAVPLTRIVILGARRCIHTDNGRWNVSTKGPSHVRRNSYYSTPARNLSKVELPSIGSLVSHDVYPMIFMCW